MAELSEEDRQRCNRIFNYLDVDRSGQLSGKEFMTGVRLLGINPTEEEVTRIMSKFDKDGNTQLSLEEFEGMMVDFLMNRQYFASKMEEAFAVFAGADRKLNKEEFRNILQNMGDDKLTDEEVEELFADLDVNNDGKLDIDELKNMFLLDDVKV
ncbi:hypothetical protein CHS0354_034854 [Potamilus streckersoni]|uniref:EF-hand domain-containing protein n=1 Tax=Potamilus streckersoni TaxID=2493646 RepID=A0AAE0TJ53_9BIVA|nr:hypothetical protein CHS0354_034854 [Potamilus streckersoni]